MDLGKTPAANAFLNRTSKEKWFPLKVVFCKNCSLLQLEHVVDPAFLFKDYLYVSSVSPANLAHFKNMAEMIVKNLKLSKKSLVVDIGSNDGILLKPFKKLSMEIVGVEPAKNIARRANAQGILTIPKFFTIQVAQSIKRKYGRGAKVITAANVFAHVDDLDALIEAVKVLLADDGVFIVEAPYIVDLLTKNTFDLIYHEHLSHLGLRPMTVLFERLGMQVFDVEHNQSHGGSMRVWVKKMAASHKIQPGVRRWLNQEKRLKLQTLVPYRQLAKRVAVNKRVLNKLLGKLKQAGKIIAGYGASAKSTTLLNYFGIDTKTLTYIVDDSIYKHGLLTPGTHIPIVAVEKIYENRPDYLMLLAWNFAEPIMKQHRRYKQLGGKFILPVPRPKIV
jgi:SAM-dependent methyltransferase